MASFLLDGVMCPAWFGLTGNPLRVAYLYDTSEGQHDTEIRISNSVVLVPEDNGESWSKDDYPTGANFVITVPDEEGDYTPERLQEIHNRLITAYNNRKYAYEAAQAANAGGNVVDESTNDTAPMPALPTEGPMWQRLGFESKSAWKAAGSPTE